MTAEAFALSDLTVRFDGHTALEGVSITGRHGEVLALVGENGAGKSTLVKVLSGVIPTGAYEGRLRVGGVERRFRDVAQAAAAGVVLVPQELAIVPHLSVAANVYLGREPTTSVFLDEGAMIDGASELLEHFGIPIDPRQPAGDLSIPQQQLVEIAKALSQHASVLILDEPTAALTAQESELLFERLRDLRATGLSIVYISHRLDELQTLADRVVVLRDGSVQLDRPISDVAPDAIVEAMVGRQLAEAMHRAPTAASTAEPVLQLSGWSVAPVAGRGPAVHEVDLEVRRGEVVALYGPIGAGRTELLRSLVGAHPTPGTGHMRLLGEPHQASEPVSALAAGIAYVSEDRKSLGIQPFMNVRENMTLSTLSRFASAGGFVDRRGEQDRTAASIDLLRIAARQEQPITTLSGGNQQKALLARALMTDPVLLLLDEPTRGIDVGAKAEIMSILHDVTSRGLGVLLASSEAEELFAVADRILVMRHGRIVADRTPRTTDVNELVALATGARAA